MRNISIIKWNLISLVIIFTMVLLLIAVIYNSLKYYYTFLLSCFIVGTFFFIWKTTINNAILLTHKKKSLKKMYIIKFLFLSLIKLLFLGGILVISMQFNNILSWEIALFTIAISPIVAFILLKMDGNHAN